jgi:hypothetical protein
MRYQDILLRESHPCTPAPINALTIWISGKISRIRFSERPQQTCLRPSSLIELGLEVDLAGLLALSTERIPVSIEGA